jgi:two-component system, OmpR family, phosphate regulon sensor histidine kinase PhoR
MLAEMESMVVLVALLALAVARATYLLRARTRELEAVRQATGATPAASAVGVVGRQRTELDAARRALAGERADREILLDLLDQGVLVVDGGGRIERADGTAHALLGRTPGTLVGHTLIEAFLDPTVEAVARAATISGSTVSELRLAGPDGPTLIVRARRAADGDVWLVLDDVSELRRLQRIRTEFIDNLSHELRTPLTTVSLLAETLGREAATAGDVIPARMAERITKIEVETGHLVQMVNELLDLSRIEGGGTLLMVDGLDMSMIAADSAERLRLFADRQGVDLRIETEPAPPPVRGDASRLGQVVVNLVHNAVKFSPDGGAVIVRTVVHEDSVVTSVQDHGVGIPRAARERIFERFYKVDRARQRGEVGGTGLGLAIARHVIEQHDGRIWVDSSEGLGSTFSFALPIAGDQAH